MQKYKFVLKMFLKKHPMNYNFFFFEKAMNYNLKTCTVPNFKNTKPNVKFSML